MGRITPSHLENSFNAKTLRHFTNSEPDVLAQFLLDKRNPSTRSAYAKDLNDFFRVTTGNVATKDAVLEFLHLERSAAVGVVLNYKAKLFDKGLSEATVNRRLASIKTLCSMGRKLGICQFTLEDVALRIGEIKDRQAIVHKLGKYRHVLVASPILLEKYDRPTKPEHLLQLPCACWNSHGDRVWRLGNETIEVNPFFEVNDYLHLLDLALRGKCVTELPPFLAQDYIANAQLKHLLIDFPLPLWELNLLYPSRRQLSYLVKTYVDFCAQWTVNLF